QEESELSEIVSLVGIDALSKRDRLKLETARSIREDYLHQNAFDATDTYTSPDKQHSLLRLLLEFYERGSAALEAGADFNRLASLPVREKLGRYKYCAEKDHKQLAAELNGELAAEIRKLTETVKE
ncbi:MAG: V-type ATP synthase subunit A, partial [Clostridia bacterium]|nr:V-type ATP synthase subunit A [Clostridia bacterium]